MEKALNKSGRNAESSTESAGDGAQLAAARPRVSWVLAGIANACSRGSGAGNDAQACNKAAATNARNFKGFIV